MRAAAFVGVAPRHDTPPGSVRRYDSWQEFRSTQLPGLHGGRYWHDIAYAVHGFFLNGGSRCYVANVGLGGTPADGLAALAAVNDVSIIAAPGCTEFADYEALTHHCEIACDRVAILDGPPRISDVVRRALAGRPDSDEPGTWRLPPVSTRGAAAFYAPWIRIADPDAPPGATVGVPASGHIAGVWARVAAAHGIHKSPAGETIAGALDVVSPFPQLDSEGLAGMVNTLRVLLERGVVVWGARTTAAESPWRYVAARRLVDLVSVSLRRGTRWAAYETPGEAVMAAIRLHVADFLDRLWRQGELQGSVPQEAYFVRCDETTTTAADVRTGTLVLIVGLAVLRPGEFVTLTIRQAEAGAEVVESA